MATTNREVGGTQSCNKRGFGLRTKLLTLLAVSLGVVFVLAATLIIMQTASITTTQADDSIKQLAGVVADSVSAYGETGDIEGLELFLKNTEEKGILKELHVVRGEKTSVDFGEREGAVPRDDVEREVLETGQVREIVDRDAHSIRSVLPTLAQEKCIGCHASAKIGDVLGVTSITVDTAKADAARAALNRTLIAVFVAMIVIEVIFFGILLTHKVIRPVKGIAAGLTAEASQLARTVNEISAFAQQLSENAGNQAASLEETSSSLEEMSAMTKQNADNAQQANTLASQAREAADTGTESMSRMSTAINDIQKSSDETAKIIKVIDEIAFQTNLLALNAAVEAARAGEAGKGFAVVAEEVRNLAMRSAEAAKNTSAMIEESVKNSKNGVEIAAEVGKILDEIVQGIGKTTDLVSEIATASQEQAQGIEQVNIAVNQMDKATQQNAANAEESASTSEELSAQAEQMSEVVNELVALVGGSITEDSWNKKTHEPASKRSLGTSDHAFHHIAGGTTKKTKLTAKTIAEKTIPMNDDNSSGDGNFNEFNS